MINYNRAHHATLLLHAVTVGILTVAGIAPRNCLGQQYSVQGEMEILLRLSPETIENRFNLSFLVQVDPEMYKIRVWDKSDRNSYNQYSYHEGTLYTLHHLQAPTTSVAVTSAGSALHRTNMWLYPALIERREIPQNDGWGAQYLWFAFASFRYVLTIGNTFMPPFWSPEDPAIRTQPFKMPIAFDLFSEAPYLPSAARFTDTGYYRSYNPATRSVDVLPIAPAYEKGFTNAEYHVTATTNIGSLCVPRLFDFIVFAVPVMPQQKLFERIHVHGVATRVCNSPGEGIWEPRFDGVACVADLRLAGSAKINGTNANFQHVTYKVTNGVWRTPKELELTQKNYERRLQATARLLERQRRQGVRRTGSVLLLVSTALLTSAVVVWCMWHKQHRRNEKQ